VEGDFENCAVLDQLAIIREGDLWNKWAPFVNRSAVRREGGREGGREAGRGKGAREGGREGGREREKKQVV
jgi:hypothetical protein